jgi:hypothetical protein
MLAVHGGKEPHGMIHVTLNKEGLFNVLYWTDSEHSPVTDLVMIQCISLSLLRQNCMMQQVLFIYTSFYLKGQNKSNAVR